VGGVSGMVLFVVAMSHIRSSTVSEKGTSLINVVPSAFLHTRRIFTSRFSLFFSVALSIVWLCLWVPDYHRARDPEFAAIWLFLERRAGSARKKVAEGTGHVLFVVLYAQNYRKLVCHTLSPPKGEMVATFFWLLVLKHTIRLSLVLAELRVVTRAWRHCH